tara:strand:+ start:111 stop:215 length:105 start_codon:yes stop_codon:yes gene_type:complete
MIVFNIMIVLNKLQNSQATSGLESFVVIFKIGGY